MKPEDIFDAITDIRDDQIEHAKPSRSRRWYVMPLAACLVLALIALPFLRAVSPGAQPLYTGTAQLAAARYPEAPKDPEIPESHDMPSSSGLPNGSPSPEPMPEADVDDGPYSDNGADGDDGIWADIEQGHAEYYENLETYTGRLAPFWTESAETFLTASQEQNLIFSPVSLYTILGMSAELCEGEPQREILELLQSPGIEDLRDSARRIWCASFSREDSSTCLLANSMWLSNSVDYKQPVLDILAENYFADSFRGDMGSPEYDRLHLEWLSEKTSGYLDGRLPELETDPSILMYLDSTLYFKGRWLDEFDPADNTEGTFHSAYMDQPCTFMRKTSEGFCYRGERFSAVTLHMFGAVEMLFVLPDEGFTTNELLADGEYKRFIATYLDFPGYWEKGVRAYINMSIPKFDVTSDMDMTLGLKKMGINGIFESGAGSFSPITDQDFSFTSVMNTCRMAIDEEGCEGASVILEPGAGATLPPEEEIDFTLDRPFLFTVIRGSGLPIYMGAVNRMAE